MRLNKHLARAMGISRRQADQLISDGQVSVNGEVAVLGKAVQSTDTVTVNNRTVNLQELSYVLFHKPVGYVCSRKEQGDAQTIYNLLPEELFALKPVGRLDKDSSGLLLLTNDGDYAQTMTHPKYAKQKVYEVELDHALQPKDRDQIESGVTLNDGASQLKLNGADKQWTVTMHEGRNRQIRRTFKAAGYQVVALHRTQFGPYEIGDLPAGSTRQIDPPQSLT